MDIAEASPSLGVFHLAVTALVLFLGLDPLQDLRVAMNLKIVGDIFFAILKTVADQVIFLKDRFFGQD